MLSCPGINLLDSRVPDFKMEVDNVITAGSFVVKEGRRLHWLVARGKVEKYSYLSCSNFSSVR